MRLPARVRITLAFAMVMALVLGATGYLVFERFAAGLDSTIEESLETRADELGALIADGIESGELSATPDVPFATVIDATGAEIAIGTADGDGEIPPHDEPDFVFPEEVIDEPAFVDGDFLSHEPVAEEDASRFFITPIDDGQFLAVGAPLESRNEALGDLKTLLWISLPLALILASLAAYGVASAALRPVEAMRRRAADIPVTVDGQRLPAAGSSDEIGRLSETLNEMLGRIEEGVARERALVADTSHELRTPLAALQAELDLADRPGRSAEELRRAITNAGAETGRLNQLAEGLLMLARADAGELRPTLRRTPVEPWVAEVAERCSLAAETDITISLEVEDGLDVNIDPELAGRALANVIDNALRFATREVTIRAQRTGAQVEIAVHDDGPGFPQPFLSRAFERFAQADAARSAGGAGVGLAIAKSIVDAHGGSVLAGNETGGVVRLILP